jgi:multidrug efflux pump subunit AcrA (membrane-fusion protein)
MEKIFIYSVILIAFTFAGCKDRQSTQPVRKNIVDAVFASGNITTENQYVVTSQTDGYLVNTFFREGDSIKAGSILFGIDDKAQAELLESAIANYEYAVSNSGNNSSALEPLLAQRNQVINKLSIDSLNFIRYQKLVQSGAVSKVEFEKAELAFENSRQDLVSIDNQISDTQNKLRVEVSKSKASLATQQNTSSYYQIKAEVDGVIFQIQKAMGELIKRGEPVAEIGSGKYIAKLFIVEDDVNKLEIGQEVFIELNTEKNKSYKAHLTKVYPYFDVLEQSFIAEATFDDFNGVLISGTQLQANIKTTERGNALVIPSEYLLPGDFIRDKEKGEIKVTVGIRTPDWIEILSGADESTNILLPE